MILLEMISHSTGEKKTQAKACGYRFLSKESLNLGIILLGGSLEIVSLWTNQFFSAIVRIQKERGDCVIDKGPYAFIRHPGYAGGTLSYLCIPFAFNSLWALIPAGIFLIATLIRTYLEDITLQKELQGYKGYAERVRYRLIPGIW